MTYQESSLQKAFSALSDPTRRGLFEAVAEQPQSVSHLASHFPISRPAVSQHLRVLQDAGLVHAKPEGARRIYAMDPKGLDILRLYIERFWTDALGAYGAEVQRRLSDQKD